MTSYEVQMLLVNRGQPREDQRPVPGAGLDDLDDDLVTAFVTRVRTHRAHAFAGLDREGVLRRSRVVVENGISLAGLLALGRYPQDYFPQLMLTFVHYPTSEGPDLVTGTHFLDNVAVGRDRSRSWCGTP